VRTGPCYRVARLPAACLLVLAFVSATGGQEPDAAGSTELLLTVGKSIIVDSTSPIERISVGFGDVAEAAAISPRELLLSGRTPGVTSLVVWQEGELRRLFNVTVVASRFLSDSRVAAIRGQIERELSGQTVDLSFENDTVFLRGTVRDITSAERAVAIASTLGKTVNLLYVDVPPPEPQILLRVKFASVDRNISTQLGLNIRSWRSPPTTRPW